MQAKLALNIIIAACLALHCRPAGAQTIIASWIQMVPGSSAKTLAAGLYGDQPENITPTILARAVVSDGICPALTLDSITPLAMKTRFTAGALTSLPGAPNAREGYPQYFVSPTATAPARFANGTPMATTSWAECEAVVPAGHKTAQIAGTTLKLPVVNPKTILLIADTGCRMSGPLKANGANQQNCADPTAFPLAYLASLEAAHNPDLVIHAGDWFYRDTDCLTGGAETYPGCNTPGSPNYETYGDTFDSWNADVLTPMKPLLAAAPWIMVRGNHEGCGRGARGWYALLDPFPYAAANVACAKAGTSKPGADGKPAYSADFEPTYVVPEGGVNILVHDSSFAPDNSVDAATAENYDLDFTRLLRTLGSGSMNIFVTHKPSFGLVYGLSRATTPPTEKGGNATEQSAFLGGTYASSAFAHGVPASIGLFLSGHIHQFEAVDFTDPAVAAPQLIVGMGGTLLDPDLATGLVPHGKTDIPVFSQSPAIFAVSSATTATLAARNALAQDDFGFAVLHAVTDANGTTAGYVADIYKTSATSPGSCKIVLKPRSIHCDF